MKQVEVYSGAEAKDGGRSDGRILTVFIHHITNCP